MSKATIVADAFLVQYFENTALVAYVDLRIKENSLSFLSIIDESPPVYIYCKYIDLVPSSHKIKPHLTSHLILVHCFIL